MRLLRALIPIMALLWLGGCAGDIQTRATSGLAIACDTYATILDSITPMVRAKKISLAAIERVSAANEAVKPACAEDSALDPAAAISTVERAIGLLNAIKGAPK